MASVVPSHVAYSDEARFNYGRYRGLALVGVHADEAPALSRALRALLDASGMDECKWEKVRSARARFATAKLLRWAVEHAIAGDITLDALTWDAGDERAARAAVPHLANLRRMYAHLLGDLLPLRHPGAVWIIHPDEQHALRWETLARALPHVAGIEPRGSAGEPLIQLADLFAGLAVYSRSGYTAYDRWLCLPPAERQLSGAHTSPGSAGRFSASDRERCAACVCACARTRACGPTGRNTLSASGGTAASAGSLARHPAATLRRAGGHTLSAGHFKPRVDRTIRRPCTTVSGPTYQIGCGRETATRTRSSVTSPLVTIASTCGNTA